MGDEFPNDQTLMVFSAHIIGIPAHINLGTRPPFLNQNFWKYLGAVVDFPQG
jgi:hypothetical protein